MKFNEQYTVENHVIKFLKERLGYEYIKPQEFAKLREFENEYIITPLLLETVKRINRIDEGDRKEYAEALEKVKKAKVTEDKIELVQDLLPASLKPDGINPLKSLHSALSDGLHNKTDDECLELADSIKTILTFLLEEIRSRNEKSKTFTEKMKKLLGQK